GLASLLTMRDRGNPRQAAHAQACGRSLILMHVPIRAGPDAEAGPLPEPGNRPLRVRGAGGAGHGQPRWGVRGSARRNGARQGAGAAVAVAIGPAPGALPAADPAAGPAAGLSAGVG